MSFEEWRLGRWRLFFFFFYQVKHAWCMSLSPHRRPTSCQMSKDHDCRNPLPRGAFLRGSGEGLPREKMPINKQTRQTNKLASARSFTGRQLLTLNWHVFNCLGWPEFPTLFLRGLKLKIWIWLLRRAPPAAAINYSWQIWPSSRGHGHVPRRLLPSPPRGHGAEGSPAALSRLDSSRARRVWLRSKSHVQGNIFFSRARVSSVAQFWQFQRRGSGWEESEEEGAATFHVSVPTSSKLEARPLMGNCVWGSADGKVSGDWIPLPFRDGRVNTGEAD